MSSMDSETRVLGFNPSAASSQPGNLGQSVLNLPLASSVFLFLQGSL